MKNLFLMMVGADKALNRNLSAYFRYQGYSIRFSDDTDALRLFGNCNPQLICLIPSRQQFRNHLDLMKQIRCRNKESPAIRTIRENVSRLASADSTVLITGETGTGKEVVAELIHRQSAGYKNPFVCINCSAIPESLIESELFGYAKGAFTGAAAAKQGYFEAAKETCLFPDEIGDMSIYAQAKILRVIEKKKFIVWEKTKRFPSMSD